MKPRKEAASKKILKKKPVVPVGKPEWCNRKRLPSADLSWVKDCGPIALSDLPKVVNPPKPKKKKSQVVIHHVEEVIDVEIVIPTENSSRREREKRSAMQRAARALRAEKSKEQRRNSAKGVKGMTPQALWSYYLGTLRTLHSLRQTGKWVRTVKDEELTEIAIAKLDGMWPYVAAMVLHVEGFMFQIEKGEADFLVADLDISDVPDAIDCIESKYLVAQLISREF